MTKAEGKIPHAKGAVAVSYQQENNRWKINIDLPKTVTGTFVWKGKKIALKEGLNSFNL